MKKLFLVASMVCLSRIIGTDFVTSQNFSFTPISGQILKLYCNYDFNVVLTPVGQVYNGFASTVKFNSWEVSVLHKSVNALLDNSSSGFVVGGNLYRAYGALPPGAKSSTTIFATTFGFQTLASITGTLLQFTTLTGGPITFGLATTADWITIDGPDVGWDILATTLDASYTFMPLPCVVDVNAPTFNGMNPTFNQRFVSSGAIFSALIYDRTWSSVINGPAPLWSNNTKHYRYSGLDTSILANYQAAPLTVDNQQWVNSGSIKITVSCPTCTSFGGNSYVLSWSDLNIILWTGDTTHNRYTWDSQDRGYRISFAPPVAYEIEKQVTVTGQVVDNPNETGAIHTGTLSLSFNAPQVPVITPLYPLSGAVFVEWKNTLKVKFYFTDDRAGIDTWSIRITIPQIMSGVDVLMTGYTYSGSDLEIILSWGAEWLGNSWSYLVQFFPKRNFPSDTWVRITWFVLDLAGNTWLLNMSFVTRPSCAQWWCNEIFQVINLTWNYAWIFDFSWALIILTGADPHPNSPYPYLAWDNWDILMCGFPYSGTILTGNIPLVDAQDVSIKWSLYTWLELYITGLNFTVEDWVIVISP